MSTVEGTTRAQTQFLRSFLKSPAGPPPADWPSIAVLRRWLRRPAFRTALHSLREVLRFQVDFDLASAAAQAARKLANPPQDSALGAHDLKRLSELLRLAHLRQRFPAEPRLDSPATFSRRAAVQDLQTRLTLLREERTDEQQQRRKHPEKVYAFDLSLLDEEEDHLLEKLNRLTSTPASTLSKPTIG